MDCRNTRIAYSCIPQVGGWIRKALDYKWIVIVAAAGLIIIGCIPKEKKAETQKAAPQST